MSFEPTDILDAAPSRELAPNWVRDEPSTPFQITLLIFAAYAVTVSMLLLYRVGAFGTSAAPTLEQSQLTMRTAELKVQAAQADATKSVQDRMLALQVKVVENCVAARRTPVWVNGNILCPAQ